MSKGPEPTLFDNPEPPAEPTVGLHGVVVREVQCRKLLNRCGIDDYSFNCYVGCGHGCGYCYARFMQRFHPHDEDWGRFVDVRINAVQALTRQLRRLEPGSVFTCSACDGWQPIEAHYRLTRECCRLLLAAGFGLNVLTKSKLVLRDLDILTGPRVQIGVTITAPDETWAAVWEPRASTVAERMEILRLAKAAGVRTAVMFGPLLPGISDGDEALARLFAIAADVGVDRVWTDVLNPRPRVWPAVQQVVRKHCPDLYEHYQKVLFDVAFRRGYERRLNARIRKAAQAAGLAERLT
ncbi:MAG: radical SAM protein [Phycisphaerae bacterium]